MSNKRRNLHEVLTAHPDIKTFFDYIIVKKLRHNCPWIDKFISKDKLIESDYIIVEKLRHNCPWIDKYISRDKLIEMAKYSLYSLNAVKMATIRYGIFHFSFMEFSDEDWEMYWKEHNEFPTMECIAYRYTSKNGEFVGKGILTSKATSFDYSEEFVAENILSEWHIDITEEFIFSLYLSEYLVVNARDQQSYFDIDPNNPWDQLDIEKICNFGWESDTPSIRFRDFVETTIRKMERRECIKPNPDRPRYPVY